MYNLIPLFIALPLLAAFLLPVVERLFQKGACTLALLASFVLVVLSIINSVNHAAFPLAYTIGGWHAPWGINLVLDGLSNLMLLIIAVVSFNIVLFSTKYMDQYTGKAYFFTLLMLLITGLNGVVLTGDLFNLYLFLEMASIASYALVAFGGKDYELEASVKYLFMGAFASLSIIMGLLLLYSIAGSVNMALLAQVIGANGCRSILIPVALFITGFGIKTALVPFHTWLPDAHTSAPAPISAMLSGVLIKAVGAYSLIRILFNVLGFSPTFSLLLLTLGTLSMLLGALLALSQNDLKRMLAYSSISQIGYIFIGLGLGTPLGIMGGLFHLVNHATFKPLLFLNAGAIEYETGTRKLNELGGIAKVMPQANAAFTIGSFSIAGLPPFNGFWSKLFIIIALVGAGYYWVALLAVIASIITLSYFMIIQKRVFFGELSEKFKGVTDAPFAMTAPMWILAVICIAAGLGFPWVINNLITPAVLVLLNGCSYGGIL